MLSPTLVAPLAFLPFALLSTSAFAQGTLGGSQASCSSADAFQYQGCFADTATGPHAGFTWQLSSDPKSAHFSPSFVGSITVDKCLQGCRGHGFRYAALYNSDSCYCSVNFQKPSSSKRDSYGNSATANTCDRLGQSCAGNSNQFCGSSVASEVYEDPSFAAAPGPSNAGNFKHLGCFTNTSPGPFEMVIHTPDTTNCAGYCGQLGYAFSGRMGFDAKSGTATCGCGSEIQSGTRANEMNCNASCNRTSNSAYVTPIQHSLHLSSRVS